nr:uncharacterized protein LOC115144456 [Oncorhynchus nerka]
MTAREEDGKKEEARRKRCEDGKKEKEERRKKKRKNGKERRQRESGTVVREGVEEGSVTVTGDGGRCEMGGGVGRGRWGKGVGDSLPSFFEDETRELVEDLYHQVEGDLVLKPEKSTVTDHITSILWKHGKNKVAEWYKDYGLDIYGTFINRTTLDQTTGELRISGLMKTDSGVYSVEFNSKLLDKTYTLSVIKAVPKPTITSFCNAKQTSCTLTCEGDTTDAEPVTYSWKVGEGPWVVGGKLLIVSKSHTGNSTNSYKYTCKLNNTVSGEGEVSEPGEEVFGSEPSIRDVVGVVVTAIVAFVFIVITGKNSTSTVTEHCTWRDGEPKRGGGTGNGGGPAAAATVEAVATAEAIAEVTIVEAAEAAATIAVEAAMVAIAEAAMAAMAAAMAAIAEAAIAEEVAFAEEAAIAAIPKAAEARGPT